MGRLKINRGPPKPVKIWKIHGYYTSSKQMIKVIENLRRTKKGIYIRKLNKFVEKSYLIYIR